MNKFYNPINSKRKRKTDKIIKNVPLKQSKGNNKMERN